MTKLTAYYAHPLSLYGTPQEDRDIKMLRQMGFDVYNPNSKQDNAAYAKRGMDHFKDVINQECDLVAFRAFPDGTIPGGVASEIAHAQRLGLPVIELPNGILRRSLSIEESREYLQDLGQR